MENPDIASVFLEIADLLELKGAEIFRVRSYRNAAVVVEGLPESLKALYAPAAAPFTQSSSRRSPPACWM